MIKKLKIKNFKCYFKNINLIYGKFSLDSNFYLLKICKILLKSFKIKKIYILNFTNIYFSQHFLVKKKNKNKISFDNIY